MSKTLLARCDSDKNIIAGYLKMFLRYISQYQGLLTNLQQNRKELKHFTYTIIQL